MPLQTCAVTYADMFKRAALLFDKVLVPWFELDSSLYMIPAEFLEVPEEVTFELSKCGLHDLGEIIREYINQIDIPRLIKMSTDKTLQKDYADELAVSYLRNIASAASRQGVNAIPLYPSMHQFVNEHPHGESLAYQAILSNIPLISDDDITWRQVLDFRNDKDACWKYRALRAWLVDTLSAKSVSEAADIIAKKLDDYEWALKRHGVKTINGVITDILAPESLTAIVASGGIAGLLAGPIGSALTAGAITLAKGAVSVSERLINLEDVKRGPGSEVALIYEVRKRFSGKGK